MGKNNVEYYFKKQEQINLFIEKLRSKNINNLNLIEENKILHKKQIENFITLFFKLKNFKKYTVEYSLTKNINVYYHLSSQQKDKRKILQIRFIYDKERKNIVDFFITPLKDESKEESILENLVFIGKISKILLKKSLFLKKYNNLLNSYLKKQLLLKNKITKNTKTYIKCEQEHKNLRYKFIKSNIHKKELYFIENLRCLVFDFISDPIDNPLSIKINLLKNKRKKYELIIKTKKDSKSKDLICLIEDKILEKIINIIVDFIQIQ